MKKNMVENNHHISDLIESQKACPGSEDPNERRLPGRAWGGIFEAIIQYDNLLLAWKKTSKLKRYRPDIVNFRKNLDENLIDIQNHLIWGSYSVGEYRNFYVYEPKKRLISALPVRDRIVQHAINNVVEPILDRQFYFDSHACRKGHGATLAVKRAHRFAKRNAHVLKCDVSQYFPSIDHDILLDLFQSKIKCPQTINLIETVIRSVDGPGIPIGNLLSQVSANLYLHELDHYCKQSLGISGYVRYMDDFLVFGGSAEECREALVLIRKWIGKNLRLTLSDRKCRVFATSEGFPYCGSTIFPTHTLIKQETIRKNRRKLRRMARMVHDGRIDPDQFMAVVEAILGHSVHSRNFSYRKSMNDAILQDLSQEPKKTLIYC